MRCQSARRQMVSSILGISLGVVRNCGTRLTRFALNFDGIEIAFRQSSTVEDVMSTVQHESYTRISCG